MNYPDILHHGAKDGVTGSCHQLLMDAEHSLLIDCSLFQNAETSPEGKSGAGQLATEFPLDTIRPWSPPTCISITSGVFLACWLPASRGRFSIANPLPNCCPFCWRMPSSSVSVASRSRSRAPQPAGSSRNCSQSTVTRRIWP